MHLFGSSSTARGPRRGAVGIPLTVASATVIVLGLVGCGGSAGEPGGRPVEPETVPDYYPADYSDLIDEARAESGGLTIYSSTDEANWAPVLRDFQRKYPFVEGVDALNLDSDEIFQRQLSEQATGNAPADLLVSNSVQAWTSYLERGESLEPYESPELAELPEVASPLPNLYSLSIDPQVLGYNTTLLTEAPTSWEDLAAQVEEDPDALDDAVGVRSLSSSFAFTVFYNLLDQKPELWDAFETILPVARPENSSGSLSEKVLAGEYAGAVFVTAGAAIPVVEQSGGIFEIVSPRDGTVVVSRAAGIPSSSSHPATAKLFVDFFLSEEGQQAVLEGGLSSYRDGLDPVEGSLSYQDVVESAGEENIVTAPFEKISDQDVAAFTERWEAASEG